MKVKSLSRVRLLATSWTAAYQARSMGFSRQEYWSVLLLFSFNSVRENREMWTNLGNILEVDSLGHVDSSDGSGNHS